MNEEPLVTPVLSDRPVSVDVVPHASPGKTLFVWMLVSGLVVLGLVAGTILNEISNNRAACARALEVRDDQRTMWLVVFDLFPDSEHVEELRLTLDELLPPLTCPPKH